MLSINTNLSAFTAQQSLKNSTRLLNQAIERMSTGFKINHASDNAANYSISTNMTTKLGAYQIAEDNVAMGLDLLTTASDSVDLVSDKFARLRALAEQAANGTYGAQSLKAINTEANAILDEIDRTFANTDYNGIKLFGEKTGEFITEVNRIDTSEMAKLAEVDETKSLTSGTYSISTAQELAKLATMTNNGKIGEDCVFVLANNIDLSEYSSGTGWTPIGSGSARFKATFDGNGYEVSNLYINGSAIKDSGLFGLTDGAKIENLGINGIEITGTSGLGGLVGRAYNSTITNCYTVNGKIASTSSTIGGLAGCVSGSSISECYSSIDIDVTGTTSWGAGGLIGYSVSNYNEIKNCYATGNVKGTNDVGGLIGTQTIAGFIENCYATGNVKGINKVGGFFGEVSNAGVKNCYATGNVFGNDDATAAKLGGFSGTCTNNCTVENCFAAGNIANAENAGGFCAELGANAALANCYSTGNMTNISKDAAGFCFSLYDSSTINNCASFGSISGTYDRVGGFIGYAWGTDSTVNNCYTFSSIEDHAGISDKGGFVGVGQQRIIASNSYFCTDGIAYTDSKATGVSSVELNNLIANGTLTDVKNQTKEFDFDLTTLYDDVSLNLQIGINSDDSSQLQVTNNIGALKINSLRQIGLKDKDYLSMIDEAVQRFSSIQVANGAAQNRLESALEDINVHYENLTSSRSTLRDADIAEVSSEYIRQQILQQASATLLATANQSPALALQLL